MTPSVFSAMICCQWASGNGACLPEAAGPSENILAGTAEDIFEQGGLLLKDSGMTRRIAAHSSKTRDMMFVGTGMPPPRLGKIWDRVTLLRTRGVLRPRYELWDHFSIFFWLFDSGLRQSCMRKPLTRHQMTEDMRIVQISPSGTLLVAMATLGLFAASRSIFKTPELILSFERS